MSPPVAPKQRRFLFDTPQRLSNQASEQSTDVRTIHRRPAFAVPLPSPAPTAPSSIDTTPVVHWRRQFASTPSSLLPPAATQPTQSVQSIHSSRLIHGVIGSTIQTLQPELLFDSIDEASQSTSGDNGQATRNAQATENVGTLFDDFEDELGYQEEVESTSPTAKRMRFSSNTAPNSASPEKPSVLSPSAAPISRRFFNLDNEWLEELGTSDSVLVSRRHAFLRSSSPVDGQLDTDPLPIQFSPHRKGQKFEPGGLAATLRSQIMDMTTSRTNQATRKNDRWTFEVQNMEAAMPIILIQGVMADNRIEHFILAGSGMRGSPSPGDTVQVNGVNWPVDLDEKQWIVCIEWKILK